MSDDSPRPLEALREFDVLVVDDTPENVRVVVGLLQGAGSKARGVPSGALAGSNGEVADHLRKLSEDYRFDVVLGILDPRGNT